MKSTNKQNVNGLKPQIIQSRSNQIIFDTKGKETRVQSKSPISKNKINTTEPVHTDTNIQKQSKPIKSKIIQTRGTQVICNKNGKEIRVQSKSPIYKNKIVDKQEKSKVYSEDIKSVEFLPEIRDDVFIEDLTINTGHINNVPVEDTDIANKAYVDATFNINMFAGSAPVSDRHLGLSSWGAVYASMAIIVPTTTVMQEIYINVLNAPGIGTAHTFEVYKNDVATGVILTISDTDISTSLTSIGLSFNVTDTYTLFYTTTGAAVGTINTVIKFYL